MSADRHPYRSPPPQLCAPPRRVPASVRIVLPFGGFLAVFGWLFFIIGSIVSLTMLHDVDLAAPFWHFAQTDRVPAEVTVVERTNVKVNGARMYAVAFHFTVDGETHSGRSYTPRPPAVGAHVDAEVPRGHVGRAWIAGTERAPMPFWAAFTLVFPLVGFAFIAVAFVRGLRVSRLLRDGLVGWGTLVDKKATGTVVNNQRVYELRFEFEADDGSKHHAVARTEKPRTLEDDAEEQLVYLPDDPDVASLIDHLPGRPRIHDDGTIAPAPLGLVLGVLLLPALGTTIALIALASMLG